MKKSNDGAARSLPEDKGFYMILFLCVAAVAVAAWVLFSSPSTVEADPMDGYMYEADDSVSVSEPLENVPSTQTEAEESAESSEQTAEEEPAEETAKPVETQPAALTFTPPMDADISRAFSDNALVYNETTGDWRTHDGADYAGSAGDAVCAIADGTVLSVGDDAIYGKYVILSHAQDMASLYAGLDEISVSEGDSVDGGTQIAVLGQPMPLEYSDGVHLHIAVTKDDTAINPASLF